MTNYEQEVSKVAVVICILIQCYEVGRNMACKIKYEYKMCRITVIAGVSKTFWGHKLYTAQGRESSVSCIESCIFNSV